MHGGSERLSYHEQHINVLHCVAALTSSALFLRAREFRSLEENFPHTMEHCRADASLQDS